MCAPDANNNSNSNGEANSSSSASRKAGTLPLVTTTAETVSSGRQQQQQSSTLPEAAPLASLSPATRQLYRRHFLEVVLLVIAGSLLAGLVVIFSISFPFWLAPWAASKTYHFAFYDYDEDISHFDNSVWTYGTDYLLAFCLTVLLLSISMGTTTKKKNSCNGDSPSTGSHESHVIHAWRSRGLLACYALSVLAGGLAHQFYTTIELRNTASFRLLWTFCVGTVTAASGFMGAIGTELVRQERDILFGFHHNRSAAKFAFQLPLVPEWFWISFGACSTIVVMAGGLSFQRPACDIFIAGITQFPSTFYMMAVLAWGLSTHPVPKWSRCVGFLGFILNAPLLPLYPLLVQYTHLSLAAVNTLLHTWLLVAWGMQGLSLRRVNVALQQQAMPPPAALPLPPSRRKVD